MLKSVFLALSSLLLVVLLATSCVVFDADPDGYCYTQCAELYPEGLKYAEWHGNDRVLGFTRCACFVDDNDGYGAFERNHLVPLREE